MKYYKVTLNIGCTITSQRISNKHVDYICHGAKTKREFLRYMSWFIYFCTVKGNREIFKKDNEILFI